MRLSIAGVRLVIALYLIAAAIAFHDVGLQSGEGELLVRPLALHLHARPALRAIVRRRPASALSARLQRTQALLQLRDAIWKPSHRLPLRPKFEGLQNV